MTPSSVQQRLTELADEHGLDGAALWKLSLLLDVLAADEYAPTPVREPRRAVDVHIADSLSGLELEAVRSARRIVDVGSGAGFPGLVLAAVLPHARVVLVESGARKAAFLQRAATAAGLDNVSVVAERVEEWEAGREQSDLVTARALASLPVVVEYAAPLLIHEGWVVAWKGRRNPDEEAAGASAAAAVGLVAVEIQPVKPFASAGERHLHLLQKIAPTPAEFPRRAGMARKRPLGEIRAQVADSGAELLAPASDSTRGSR